MSSISQVAESISAHQQEPLSLNFAKQELDEKPCVKGEPILDKCISEKFKNFTEESEDIGLLTDENVEICSRQNLTVLDINGIKTVVKCDRDNENQSDFEAKEEFGCSINETCVIERNFASVQEVSSVASSFIDQSMQASSFNRVKKDTSLANNASMNEEFVKHEENFSSDDQLRNEAELLVDQKDFIDALMPKEESESIDIEESKIFVHHFIKNEEIKCNDDAAEWYTHTIDSKENQDFATGNESCSFTKLEAENCLEEQIEDRIEDLKLEKHKCLPCDSSVSMEINLHKDDSVNLKVKNHKCHICDYSASRKSVLQNHINSVHTKLKNHKCHFCNYSASSESSVHRHMNCVHFKMKNNNCHFCDYSTSQIINLQRHIDSVHLNLKNHKCHICDYSASKRSVLQRHINSVHLNLKNHTCHICAYSASLETTLKKHIDSVHLKLKNHKCHLCDYSASCKSRVKRHMNSVHLKLKNSKCQFCDYSASTKVDIRRHIDSVHMKLKNHKCHICDYSASRKIHIQMHIDCVHFKLKKHKCHICDYISSQKSHLQRHIHSVHLKLKNSNSSQKILL